MNAILHLSTGSMGPALTLPMLTDGSILRISREIIKPFYREKMQHALDCIERLFVGCPYRVHRPEGAFFLWMWFEGLPISSAELYSRLKKRGVIILPGHHFFPGLMESWRHCHECIRISYSQEASVVERGLAVIAQEVRELFCIGLADSPDAKAGNG